MNRAIPDEIIEEIRSRVNIVDLLGSYVHLKRGGNGVYKALCPFHQEKTPSFTVNENRQSYHCFGCGKGGDVFRFVMERENVDFPNAVHLLASRCGVIIPEKVTYDAGGKSGRERADERERLYRLSEEFAQFFEKSLFSPSGKRALDYLHDRGIPDDVIRKFRIGYSPDEWDAAVKFARSRGFSDDEMVATGTVRRNDERRTLYDHFKGRLTFSIWNENGKVVGFSARTLEKDAPVAKYVNTPETPIFKKGNILYALPIARPEMRTQNMAILCEGQLDVIAMHRAGFQCAVAPQGTGFTVEQARILKRSTQKILLGFDSDSAGQKAILRAIELILPLDMEIGVIRFPGGKDPDELFKNEGADAIAGAVDKAENWLDFFERAMRAKYDFSSVNGRSQAAGEFLNLVKLVENAMTRELYLKRGGEMFNLSYDAMLAELAKINRAEERRFSGSAVDETKLQRQAPKPEYPANYNKAMLLLLEAALNFCDKAREMAEILPRGVLEESGFSGKALDMVLNEALYGDHDNCYKLLSSMLHEEENPEISKLCVKDTKISENDVDKIMKDCILLVKQIYKKKKQQQLTDAMRQEPSAEGRMMLLKQLIELDKQER
ncbi:MAG: DNA primase [Lentisphaeria bacterium]|nr:DNA primase [Lentisphaeria bacterium]